MIQSRLCHEWPAKSEGNPRYLKLVGGAPKFLNPACDDVPFQFQVPHTNSSNEAHFTIQRAYAAMSIIGTVPLNWSIAMSLNRKAVAAFCSLSKT